MGPLLTDKTTFFPPLHYWPVLLLLCQWVSNNELNPLFSNSVFSLRIKFISEGPSICNVCASSQAPILHLLGVIHYFCTCTIYSALFQALGNQSEPSRQVPLPKEFMLKYFSKSILNQFGYLYSLLELIISEIHSSFMLPLPKSIVFTLETLFLYVIEAAYVLLLKIYCDSILIFFFASFKTAI